MARPGRRLVRAAGIAAGTYTRTGGNQRAAAISYHVLFSLVPFLAVLVSVLELVLSPSTQERVVAWLVGLLPLSGELSQTVEDAVELTGPSASLAGAVALVGLVWGASGMMGAVRLAFRAVWDGEANRPYLRAKLLDVILVLGTGLLIVTAFGLSIAVQIVTDTSSRIVTDLGGSATGWLGALAQLAATHAAALLAFVVLYRVVPPVAPRLRDVLPGALVATVGVAVATAGFSFYLDRFANFDDVYGPLGTVLAFLLLVYVVAAILIFGACIAAGWPEAGADSAPPPGEPVPLRVRLVRLARGLVVRD